MGRDALQNTLEHFPREQMLVRRAYRSLVLMRGIVWHARKVIAEEKKQRSPEPDSPCRASDFVAQMGTLVSRPSVQLVVPSSALLTRATGARACSHRRDTLDAPNARPAVGGSFRLDGEAGSGGCGADFCVSGEEQ